MWHVARSRPGHEAKAAAALEEAGLQAYCPRQRTTRVERGRKQERLRALYTSYLFLKGAIEGELTPEEWHAACDDRKVRLIGRVSDAALDRDDLDPDGIRAEQQPETETFRRGQRLVIADGPFAGRAAICLFDDRKGVRVRLSDPLLGRDVELYVEPDALLAEKTNNADGAPKRRYRTQFGLPRG